jgi:hypothetical protein
LEPGGVEWVRAKTRSPSEQFSLIISTKVFLFPNPLCGSKRVYVWALEPVFSITCTGCYFFARTPGEKCAGIEIAQTPNICPDKNSDLDLQIPCKFKSKVRKHREFSE